MSNAGKITPFLMFQFAVVALVLLATVLRPGAWDTMRILGFIIALFAAAILFIARYQIGSSFSVTPQARALVTHGIYSKIRNPIYVFSALLLAGVFISFHFLWGLLLLLVLIPIQTIRAQQESKVLEEKFGEDYREYRKRTWF
jgi:protein-S-isoprenylcysteine O-methyltransferase Ste14